VRATLADGRSVVVRPLTGADASALTRFVETADADDLRRRFMGLPPPTDYLVERLRAADGDHDLALGAFGAGGVLVGVAQFDRMAEPDVAEVAIEVAHDWQRVGLARLMLVRLVALAREHGIRRFAARYYADNIAIRRLLRDTGLVDVSRVEAGEGFAELDLERVPVG
jgi:acetyltransferase